MAPCEKIHGPLERWAIVKCFEEYSGRRSDGRAEFGQPFEGNGLRDFYSTEVYFVSDLRAAFAPSLQNIFVNVTNVEAKSKEKVEINLNEIYKSFLFVSVEISRTSEHLQKKIKIKK